MAKLKIRRLKEILRMDVNAFNENFPELEGNGDDYEFDIQGDEELTLDQYNKAIEIFKNKKGKEKVSPYEIVQKGSSLKDFNDLVEKGKEKFPKVEPAVLFDLIPEKSTFLQELAGKIPEGKKIEPNAFKMIMSREKAIDKANKPTADAAREGLSNCVEAMLKNDINLTQFIGKNKIGRVMALNDDQLAGAGHLLNYLGENLADSKLVATNTIDYILDQKFSNEQAKKITEAFTAMQGLELPVRGNRQPIMDLAKDATKLANLTAVLAEIKVAGVKKLDQKDLDLLLEAPDLAGKGPSLGRCIKAMQANGIELNFPMIDLKSRDTIIDRRRNHLLADIDNLQRLTWMSQAELEGMATVLESLGAQTPGDGLSVDAKKSFLDERTFNYIIDHPDLLKGKATQIATVFTALRKNDISLEGLRQPIMGMRDPSKIQALAEILDPAIWKDSKAQLDKDEIKSLVKHIGTIPEGVDPKTVGESLKALKSSGLNMTTLNPFGTDRIEQIVQLEKEGAVAAQQILTALSKADALAGSATDIVKGDVFDDLMNDAVALGQPTEPAIAKRDDNGKQLPIPPTPDAPITNIATKADLLAKVFSNMHAAGMDIVGNRRAIMALPASKLDILSEVLRPMTTLEEKDKIKLNKDEVAALLKAAGTLDATGGQKLGECIKEMRKHKIPLTSLLPGEDNLTKLAELDLAKLSAVSTVLAALSSDEIKASVSDPRNVDIFNHLTKPETLANLIQVIQFDDLTPAEREILMGRGLGSNFTTADRLANVYKQMKAADINIGVVGHRRPLMNMNAEQLKNLSSIIGAMKTDQIGEPLSKKEFKALIEHAENFKNNPPDPNRGENLGKCIKAMRNNKISLTTLDLTRDHNLDRLAALNADELGAVTTILDTLANTKPKSSLGASKTDPLNNATFDYLMKKENREALSEVIEGEFKDADKKIPRRKADLVADVFTKMNDAGIEVTGHRQAIMEIGKTKEGVKHLKNLAEVLDSMPKLVPPLNKDEFSALLKHVNNLEPKKADDESLSHGELLGQCITAMRDNKISLTSLLPGEDNLSKLAKLSKNQLPAVATILKGLQGNINASVRDPRNVDIFNYLVEPDPEHPNRLADLNAKLDPADANPEIKTKADRLVAIFKQMEGAKIDVIGHRRPLMDLSPNQLKTISTILSHISPSEITALSAREFGALIQDPDKKLSGKMNQADNLGKCIKALNDNGISLTTLDPRVLSSSSEVKHPLTKLVNLDAESELPGVTTLLTKLAGDPESGKKSFLDGSYSDFYKGDITQFIIDNAEALGTPLSTEEMKNITVDGKETEVPRTKADLVADIFDAMRQDRCNTDITGNRRPIMKLNEEELRTLHDIMKGLNEKPKGFTEEKPHFSKDSMTELVKHIPKIVERGKQEELKTELEGYKKPTDPGELERYNKQLEHENEQIIAGNAERAEDKKNLISCIDTLKKNGVGLSNFFGANKVDRLTQLPHDQLAAVTKVMESLGKKGKLDPDTFDNIMKHAKDLAGPAKDVHGNKIDGKTKADQVAEAFDALHNNRGEIIGARNPIMELSGEKLAKFTEVVNTGGKGAFGDKADVKKFVGRLQDGKVDLKQDPKATLEKENAARYAR